MNVPEEKQTVNWLFLDLNAFFASCEQQENEALRGKPIIVAQMPSDSTVAIAASYEAKAYGIKTGTRVKEAKHLCTDLVPVQANHKLYSIYHERVLEAVDTCVPVEKVLGAARAEALFQRYKAASSGLRVHDLIPRPELKSPE